MKICFITNLYEPYSRGGAEVIVKRTAEEMVKQGHNVVVITARSNPGPYTVNNVNSVKIIRFRPSNIFFYTDDYKHSFFIRCIWHLRDIFNWKNDKVIHELLMKEEPDVIITHNLIGLGFLIPRAIKRLGIGNVHVLHDIQLAVRSGIMKKGEEKKANGVLPRIYQYVTRRMFGSPDIVISPSRFLLEFYKSRKFFPNSEFILLRNPITKDFFADRPKQSSENVVFGYIGQLAQHKGLSLLKSVFEKITRKDIRLLIIGDGPLSHRIKQWSEQDKRIIYLGKIPNTDLPQNISQMDAVILPTLTYENSPTVVYESMACGVPVIASDMGGTGELIESGLNGLVFNSGDEKSLLDCLRRFLSYDVCQKTKMKQNARLSVATYGMEHYVKYLLNLIKRLS